MCELGVEADEEVVILEAGEGALGRCCGWEVGYVVESCGGGECWAG